MGGQHSKQTAADGIHILQAYEYADASARTGASGFVAGDVGKVAKQIDNDTYFILTATTPTWKEITPASASHTIASHSDTTATGTELETLTDGSNADALHTHSGSTPDFNNGGDTAGADRTIGNNDAFAIAIETNGIERLKVFDDGGVWSKEKMDIGKPESATVAGLDVGHGGSYRYDSTGVEAIEYWQKDDSAASGSKFTRYTDNAGVQLTAVGDCIIYSGRTTFTAIRQDIDAVMVVGGGSLIWEYYNGSTWTEIGTATYKKTLGTHRGDQFFRNIETQYTEVGLEIFEDLTWSAANNVLDEIPDHDSGVNMFCIQVRVVTAITTGVTFSSGKARRSDFDISSSADLVMWGEYRKRTLDEREQGLFNSVINAPASDDINLSTNITLDGDKNSFSANAIDQLTRIWHLPTSIDTSTSMNIYVTGFGTTTATADIEFQIFCVKQADGDVIDSGTLTEITNTQIITHSFVTGEQKTFKITLPMENLTPNDKVAIMTRRDGSAGNLNDTYGGAFTIRSIGFEPVNRVAS